MIKRLAVYSAAAAKCRAMYGKGLKERDWERLADAQSLRTFWELLSRSPAWTAVSEAPRGAEDLGVLLESVNEQLRRDCAGLALYLPLGDRAFLETFRDHLGSGMGPDAYRQWWDGIGKKNRELQRLVGAEADVLNLVYALRLRRFPASIGRAPELLIPVRDRIRPEFIQSLLHTSDDAAVLEMIGRSPWKKQFTSLAPGVLESQYEAYMRSFCRRILVSARPGPEGIQAFLTLKDKDRKRLADMASAVANGIDPHRVI